MNFNTIVGIGNFGCKMCLEFEQSGFDVYLFDSEQWQHKNFQLIEKQKKHEDYDKLEVSISSEITDKDVLFCICGSGFVSGASLRILECLKHQNNRITILYNYPEINFLSKVNLLQHRVVFGVLQEMTRSGVFEELIVVGESMQKQIPGISLLNKWQKINQIISSTLANILHFQQQSILMGSKWSFSEHYRISTIGTFNTQSQDEVEFHPLSRFGFDEENGYELPFEVHYFYIVPETEAEENLDLYSEIVEFFDAKRNSLDTITFSIHSSLSCSERYGFFVKKTPQIQKLS